MSRPVGLDMFSTDGTTGYACVIGGWSGPCPTFSFTEDTWYRYRIRIEAGQIRQKIWLDSDPEPSSWTSTDTAPQGQTLTFTPSHLWIMNANYGVRLTFDWIKLLP